MDHLKDVQPKCKRMRTSPVKKWNLMEEKSLIEFLMENRDFEKPTAQAYYKRFSNKMNVVVEWKLIRAKVRNMRTSYNKAKGWEGSRGAGSMDGETIKATLLKKCSFYFELDAIFGTRLTENAIIEETLETLLTADTLECTEVAEIEEISLSNHSIITENVTAEEYTPEALFQILCKFNQKC